LNTIDTAVCDGTPVALFVGETETTFKAVVSAARVTVVDADWVESARLIAETVAVAGEGRTAGGL
jgi:hypothetical protein